MSRRELKTLSLLTDVYNETCSTGHPTITKLTFVHVNIVNVDNLSFVKNLNNDFRAFVSFDSSCFWLSEEYEYD
jgi:hypothetical protein